MLTEADAVSLSVLPSISPIRRTLENLFWYVKNNGVEIKLQDRVGVGILTLSVGSIVLNLSIFRLHDDMTKSSAEVAMRRFGFLFLFVMMAPVMFSQAPAPASYFQNVATMSQLMVQMIYPTSNDIFYIGRKPPQTDYEWGLVERSAL